MSALDKAQILHVYQKRARNYNVTANLYYAIGFREYAYRKKAAGALKLRKGDTVVEISCGTGLNFPYLQDAVGDEGRIIGVDLTEAMLDKARRRVEQYHWGNVELIHCDAGKYTFPEHIDGILSSFAITLIPEFDEIIMNGARALKPGKRLVILDFRIPSNWLAFLAPLAITIMKPFGVSPDLADRHPWESIERHLHNLKMESLYGGLAYIARGEKTL
jgi:ubiquinone/menaquinone biosynthesis C-methylase UbiE